MKPQKPAEGILLNSEYGASKNYTVVCDCGCNDHDHRVWVEASDFGITVTTYTKQKTNWWNKTRWHHMWTLLTKGYIEVEGDTILSEQQALNYAETLKTAIKDVKTFREERLKNKQIKEDRNE